MSKLTLDVKAKDMVMLDSEWTALKYDDTGSSQSASYSPYKPFKFDQAVVTIDGSPNLNYDNIQMVIDDMTEADPTLNGSIYPSKIYSQRHESHVCACRLFLEDTVQYAKFLAGTLCT